MGSSSSSILNRTFHEKSSSNGEDSPQLVLPPPIRAAEQQCYQDDLEDPDVTEDVLLASVAQELEAFMRFNMDNIWTFCIHHLMSRFFCFMRFDMGEPD